MIFEKIRDIICEQLDKEADKVKLETNFKTDLKADSLDLFQIINDIEDEFNVKIENIEDINTISDVVKLIEEQSK